jgi:hypothetical protein
VPPRVGPVGRPQAAEVARRGRAGACACGAAPRPARAAAPRRAPPARVLGLVCRAPGGPQRQEPRERVAATDDARARGRHPRRRARWVGGAGGGGEGSTAGLRRVVLKAADGFCDQVGTVRLEKPSLWAADVTASCRPFCAARAILVGGFWPVERGGGEGAGRDTTARISLARAHARTHTRTHTRSASPHTPAPPGPCPPSKAFNPHTIQRAPSTA